ncbi:phosphatase PAP2 family protein [bacterium]|nr:phosphatase PAP2 family protein [bacterium]
MGLGNLVRGSAAFLLFTQIAVAGWNDIPATDYALPAPPAAGSAAYEKDFETLHDLEKTRTAAECQMASAQQFPTVDAFFGHTPLLSKKQFKESKDLVKKVMKYTEEVTNHFKLQHMRPRPFNTDTTLTPCAPKPGGSKAYPSSHASMAAAGACVLAEIFPTKAKALLAYGKSLGDLRITVGVHHPSDVAAGQNLAAQICERLVDDSDFQHDLQKVN